MASHSVPQSKRCSCCGDVKAVTEFYRFKHSKDGLTARCKVCSKAKDAEYRERNRAALIQRKRDDYGKNRERRLDANRRWRERHPERQQELSREWLLRGYGLTEEGFEEILRLQGHVCAMCGKAATEEKRSLHVDHDHSCCPGKRTCGLCIRGLLCTGCNTFLGRYEKIGHLADKYLERFKDGNP